MNAATDAARALDRAIDEATGMPSAGRIEEFTFAGMTLVAELHGDPAATRTFVLIHGIGMGRKVFGDLVSHLVPHGLVVAIDQPGYGSAPEPERTPTMQRTADLVAAYLRHLARGPVVLVGHSMGTQVATEVAVRHPESVAQLVLVAPTVDADHRHALTQLARLGRDLIGESAKVLLLGAREYVRARPHLRRKMRAMLTHEPERAYPLVHAPTLIIRGETDRVSPRAWCERVEAAIPGATSFEVPGHGHETLIRDAEPSARAMLAWLDAAR